MPTAPATARTDPVERARVRLVEVFLAEGFAHLGVGDLASRAECSRTTLYRIAGSKEQVVAEVVRSYFRQAAERIDDRIEETIGHQGAASDRLEAYLLGVAAELSRASERFARDLAADPVASQVYRANTDHAAARVAALLRDGVRDASMRPVDAEFVGAVVAQVMAAIQRGDIAGVAHAEAYRKLADLVVRGVGSRA